MKFGLRYCNTGRYVDPVRAVELMQAAEEAGFESAWTVEHTVVPAGYRSPYPYSNDGKMAGGVDDFPLPDPLIWMAYVAAATTKIKLATGILILPQHNPVVVAKQVASLDYLSKGRVLLGVGVGWMKEEFDALGVAFDDRGARTDDYIHALRALWSQVKPTYDGQYVKFANAYCRPQPYNGTVPIIVGGHSRAAARRAGKFGDGFIPARGTATELIELARRTAQEHGRDPHAVEITTGVPDSIEDIPALSRIGISRVLVPVTAMPGMSLTISHVEDVLQWRATIERFAE